MSARVLYEAAERQEQDGLAAYRQGDTPAAKNHLLQAAKLLVLSAQEVSDDLKRARLEKSRRLQALAAKLPQQKARRGAAPAGPSAPAPTEAEAAEDGEGFVAMEKPRLDFAGVAGMEEVKEQIRMKMIYPFLHPEKAAAYRVRRGGGILLYGPPGTGKTLIARATAGELDAAFFTVRPSQILSKWVGEAEQNVAKLFETAREEPKAVVFIDEVEALVPKRTANNSSVMARVVPQILTELEGIDTAEKKPILFMGATNTPWALDPAVLRPGRFDELVYIGLPEPVTRRRILELQLEGRPLDPAVTLDTLVERTGGYSGADLRNLVERVAGRCFRESIETGEMRPMQAEDFEAALRQTQPSVRPDLLKKFEKFAAERKEA